MTKADAARIDALERELGIGGDPPKPLTEMTGYVVLMDSQDREASDRVRVTFTISSSTNAAARSELKMTVKINGGPITLTPTRFGLVRAVAVFDGGGQMPACYPDRLQEVQRGWTFTLSP